MIDVNIKGVLNGFAAILPAFLEQKSGHLINMSSVAGTQLFPSGTVYCATKFAVEAISKGIRAELSASENIRVTSIRPGPTTSNLTNTITDPVVRGWIDNPGEDAKEILTADDIARAVVYAATQPNGVSVTEVTVRPTSDD